MIQEKQKWVEIEQIAKDVVDAAIKVHRALGPGLLESAYQACFAYELRERGHLVETEVPVPIHYNSVLIDAGYRLDMIVDNLLVIENKSVDVLLPVHEAQLLTYLKLSGYKLGFLLNWNVKLMKQGIHRLVNHL